MTEMENGWREWGKHVLAQLESLTESSDKQNEQLRHQGEKIAYLETQVATLNVKAGWWGFAGSFGGVALFILIQYAKDIVK